GRLGGRRRGQQPQQGQARGGEERADHGARTMAAMAAARRRWNSTHAIARDGRGRHNARMRILHTMLRVGDLQRSIDFYTRVLGMQLLRTTERPEQKYSLAFVGYGSNPEHAEIELTYNHGVAQYEMGTAYGHIALGVEDAYAACDRIRAAGGTITREP